MSCHHVYDDVINDVKVFSAPEANTGSPFTRFILDASFLYEGQGVLIHVIYIYIYI